MASRPPRVTSRHRQPTTRGGPRVTSRAPQPTTGRGRIVQRVTGPFGRPVGFQPISGVPAAPVAPAAPITPAAPAYSLSALPPDASYDAQIAALQQQRDNAIAAYTQARTSGLSDYGFTEGPNGTLAVDLNNANSKAALMKHTYDVSRRSTGQSMASGGQLYSGAFQNAQDLVNRNQMQSEDSLQKALIGFLARNTQGVTNARTGYETAAGQAYGDRVSRFQSNPLYDPAASGPDAAAATPAAPAAASAAASAAKPTNKRPKRPKGVGVSAISGYYRR